jgi:hypothetical protein
MADFYPQTLVDYAQIVGALATSAAVIVSLYIANKKPKPVLGVNCDVRHVVWQHQRPSDRPRYLVISAVNTGNTDAIITGVGWKLRSVFGKTQWAHQDANVGDHIVRNPVLPHKVAHGETVQFFLPLQGQYNWTENLEGNGMFIERITSRGAFDNLRAVVFTSVGDPILCKPSKSTLDMMWEHQQVCLQAQSQLE